MMRARFLAAAGAEAPLRRLVQKRGWSVSPPAGWTLMLDLPDLVILGRLDSLSLLLPSGAILGTLLRRTDAGQVVEADSGFADEIASSAGQNLIESYWGSWFAICTQAGGHWALRDPSASAPAYYRTRQGVSLYFSDLDAAAELEPESGKVDMEFIRQWVSFPHLRTARTGLKGTSELLPGTRRQVADGAATLTAAWDPWTFASRDRQIDDFDGAAERVKRVALHVIPAQVRDRGRLLLELSGGLDSSIIAAALKAGNMPFETINFVTRTAEGDERLYARAVASATSERHFEIDEREAMLELALPDRQRLRPGLNPVMGPLHRQFAEEGRRIGAQTYLTGAGGDNVFCYLTTAAPILDAWQGLGRRAAIGKVLPDVSEMCGCNVWTAARFALRKSLRGLRHAPLWRRDVDFLHADAAPAAPEFHPWLEGPGNAAPGKREHIAALLRIQHVTDPATRLSDLPFIHPLIAQPLVELCLRIPTWLWVQGGRNRAVARRAFRGLLPDDVLDRRSKGRLEGMCVRAYMQHKPEIGELLLGGMLRQTGLLDPDPLESYLELEGPPLDARYFRLFELISAELWLRSWRG